HLDALDDDQPVGVGGQDAVAAGLRGQAPVGGGVAAAPGGLAVGLVVQVGADDGGVAAVAGRQHLPVGDPALLAVGGGVPELGLPAGAGAVPVEQDADAAGAGLLHQLVQDLDGLQPHQVGILVEV